MSLEPKVGQTHTNPVILKEEYPDQSSALKRERWLKSGVGRAFIKTLEH
ncbi:MAG: hypothetical protein R2850_12825 [Bacteroidia bacterium]